jgi:hypothetical protein
MAIPAVQGALDRLPEQGRLEKLHTDFGHQALWTGCSVAAASFLLTGALIVIGCGCLCLMLPGINVLNAVLLPAVLPGILGIIGAIPFILLAVKHNRAKNDLRTRMIDQMVALLQNYRRAEQKKEDQVSFILKHFFKSHWSLDYREKILNELKGCFEKKDQEQTPEQKSLTEALDGALEAIRKKK